MPSSASIIPYGIRKDAVKIKLKTLRVKYNVFSVTFHFGGPAFFSSFPFLIALLLFFIIIIIIFYYITIDLNYDNDDEEERECAIFRVESKRK